MQRSNVEKTKRRTKFKRDSTGKGRKKRRKFKRRDKWEKIAER